MITHTSIPTPTLSLKETNSSESPAQIASILFSLVSIFNSFAAVSTMSCTGSRYRCKRNYRIIGW